ncbi:MAG TPA: BTAD domain-containing putative transcriptional regulator, partial [Anaerolineales bacterium]|nr:BTAD domain-containing putative transcriptional regulator [Anaerolineales bacterium]
YSDKLWRYNLGKVRFWEGVFMHLTVQLLGTPQFQLNERHVTASRRAVVALLAYLTFTSFERPGQRFTRESLASLLWSEYEPSKALANLRHTLWEIAKFIGEGWIVGEYETIYLDPRADVSLDVAQLQTLHRQATGQPNPADRVPLLVEAASLYRGDFLHGFSLKEGAGFNEWALTKGEDLRREFAAILEMLVDDYHAMHEMTSAIPYAQRLIALDPLNEKSQRKLMQLFALSDQQNAAIQQYLSVEKLLRKELNLDPQPETRELYKKIRRGDFKIAVLEKKASDPKAPPKHNLPVHLTTFIGREKEREEISRLVARHRLVTLTGAGGIGKTRLALQIGHSLLSSYPDGVWFIPLETLTDEELVPQVLASYFDLEEGPGRSVLDRLVDALRSKNLLLLLDNCEHVLEACALLAETLLGGCPQLRILETSRDVLRIEGEAVYSVHPLRFSNKQVLETVDQAMESEAIQLFAERAALAASDFQITAENLATVAGICQRVDGIPLAIELAAAHMDMFTPGELLRQLERSFDLLTSSARSVLPRHQTMRTSIDWGWDLLDQPERAFMRQCSVFLGGWTLEAAQAILTGNARELTEALLKRSFVVVQQKGEYETRYRMHEVIRLYAQEKLSAAGEEQMLRDRHLDYFVALLKQAEPALLGVERQSWLERLFLERDNVRGALVWAAKTNVQAGLWISKRLRALWESSASADEAGWLLTL